MSPQDDNGTERSSAQEQTRARDHLANERTYLAWVRTAANVMVLGLAVARFVNSTSVGSVVAGVLLVAVGASGVGYGTIRYRRVSADIEQGRFGVGASGAAAVIASTVLVGSVVAALAILLATRQ